MKKLLSVYSGILVLIVLVVMLGTSCTSTKEQPKCKCITPGAVTALRAMSLMDSTIMPLYVNRSQNVYRKGDKVWVWTKNPDSLYVQSPSAEVLSYIKPHVVRYGTYVRYQITQNR